MKLSESYKVTYSGKMRSFTTEEAAKTFAKKHPGATIKFVREAQVESGSGEHIHPHDQDGDHAHSGLEAGGSHAHDDANIGGLHNHAPGQPFEGAHLNVGAGAHDHLRAKDLDDYVKWVADQHHPVHKWLPGHVKTLLRHIRPGKPERVFREAQRTDWVEHTLWGMHSTGIADVDQHSAVFLDLDSKFVEKIYVFEDGTMRPASKDDFETEKAWFAENMPPELAARLVEADVFRAGSFDKSGFAPHKYSNVQICDEWRLLASKFAQMVDGIDTEFHDEIELAGYAARVLKEVVRRRFVKLDPRSFSKRTREFLKMSVGILAESYPNAGALSEVLKLCTVQFPIKESLQKSSMGNLELIAYHFELHKLSESDGSTPHIVKEHSGVSKEMVKRGLLHRANDDLDTATIVTEAMGAGISALASATVDPITVKRGFISLCATESKGKKKVAKIHVNTCNISDELLKLFESHLLSKLPEDVKADLISGDEIPSGTFMPIADLKIEFLPLDQRKIVRTNESKAKNKKKKKTKRRSGRG